MNLPAWYFQSPVASFALRRVVRRRLRRLRVAAHLVRLRHVDLNLPFHLPAFEHSELKVIYFVSHNTVLVFLHTLDWRPIALQPSLFLAFQPPRATARSLGIPTHP